MKDQTAAGGRKKKSKLNWEQMTVCNKNLILNILMYYNTKLKPAISAQNSSISREMNQ